MLQIKLLIQAENIYVGRMLLHSSVALVCVFITVFTNKNVQPVKVLDFEIKSLKVIEYKNMSLNVIDLEMFKSLIFSFEFCSI